MRRLGALRRLLVSSAAQAGRPCVMIARVLQTNVFEDGLTDAPGAIGLSSEFSVRFNALLDSLSDDGTGQRFICFKMARDFSVLPQVAPLRTSAEFFGFLDLVYNILYHPLGGEARLADPDGGSQPAGPDLANCLRTLFLCSAVDEYGRWSTPRFEAELDKSVGGCDVSDAAQQMRRDRIQSIRGHVFDPDHGTLSWERSQVEAIWKRGNNVWHDKWCKDLRAFLADVENTEQLAALMSICRRGAEPAVPAEMASFIYAQVDASGAVQQVTSMTLHSAVRLLLLQLCRHSLQNDGAAHALCRFLDTATAPPSAEDRAAAVTKLLMAEVEHWRESSSLPERHRKFCDTIAEADPSIITAVEFDGQWRKLPLPTNRSYVSARNLSPERGCGQATILYDSAEFEPVHELPGDGSNSELRVIPGVVRSLKEQGLGESAVRPKSSCMLLLRQHCRDNIEGQADSSAGQLLLVCAVHLESAQPSDTRKVLLRRQQVRAMLSEVSGVAKSLLAAGAPPCTVAIGGDFNAIREEFLHGNSGEFFACAGTQLVKPAFRPPVTPVGADEMGDPIAVLEAGGPLRMLCDGVDGGELVEATMNSAERPGPAAAPSRVACTRAGKSMVIDFVFCGVIGGGAGGSGTSVRATPHVLASDEEAAQAADEGYGVRRAVLRWGSDHLPVACDLSWV